MTLDISLGEGNTPLIRLPDWFGFELWLKNEGMNPTGSFKDRGMAVAVSRAKERGATRVLCASTGNTAASAAAYAARAKMHCTVLVPKGGVAHGKLAAAMAHGARIIEVDGTFDAALALVRKADPKKWAVVNSINPDRLEGQMTAALEIIDKLPNPNAIFLPVGNGGNITAYGMALDRMVSSWRVSLYGVQADGAAPFLLGHAIDDPRTVASAIRIGHPARWHEARAAVVHSGGKFISVTDAELLEAWRLSANQGIWVEPASAAGLAGLFACQRKPEWKTVVVVATGHGLKDPDSVEITADSMMPEEIESELR